MTNAIPTWPLLQTAWGAAYSANGGAMPTYGVDISLRVLNSQDSKRGKQYELDTAQAGELTTTLRNSDAVLDPTNTTGPFGGHVLPYQPFQVQAQYPATQNLLTYVQATGGEGYGTGTIPASFEIHSTSDATGGQIVAPGDAYNGTNVFQFVNNTGPNARICTFESVPVQPNTAYTIQLRIRCVTAGVTAHVGGYIGFYSAANIAAGASPSTASSGPTVTLTGAASGATWTLLSYTATSPAGACGMSIGVTQTSAASGANNVQIDVAQVEIGTAATTWTQPNPWYPLFTGFIERWPTKWAEGGTWGTINSTVTDAFALMSQGQLSDPLTEEINALNPRFLYRLDDADSSAQAAEASGRFPALNVVSGKYGAGSVTFGSAIGSATANGLFTAGGVSPSVTSFAPGATVSGWQGASVLSLDESGIVGPANPLSWTRLLSFRYTGGNSAPAGGVTQTLWGSFDSRGNGIGGSYQLQLVSGGGGTNWVGFTISLPNGTGNISNGPTAVGPAGYNPYDGNWHLVVYGYNDAAQTAFCSVDGVTASMFTALGSGGWTPAIFRDSIGGYLNGGLETTNEFQGDLSFAAEFPGNLTATQIQNLYSAWRNACAGETSAARYARILRYAKYTGPTNISAGLTSQMGPATDLAGSDAFTCLNNVVVTENGNHFVARDGTITFQGRNYRYNVPTPAFVFGEASGEYPYEDLQLDFDTTHLGNDVSVTQNSTGQAFFAANAASQTAIFDRTMTRTINVQNAAEAQDAAGYMVKQYSQPLTRVTSITLNPAGAPALWPVILQLELGMCIQINRRPIGCPTISLLMWIEQLSWSTDDKGNFRVTMQCSPANQIPQAQFAMYQTTLSAIATAGQPTITVAPLTDTVNPLNAFVYPGDQFQVHSTSGVTFETLTVKTVQATGSNWTSGTITFTSNLSVTHPVGAIASNPSPVGLTSLNQYNPNAVFDSVVFTY